MTASIGFWPDGDYRRWICSEVTGVDGSRMAGISMSPYAAQAAYWPLHFFDYPDDAKKLLFSGIFPENPARPDDGAAAYHYDPRTAATVIVSYSSSVPALAQWSNDVNDPFKKESMWSLAPPEKFLDECQKDWERYSKAFKGAGSEVEPPPYPYKLEQVYDLLMEEQKDIYESTMVSTGQMNGAQLSEAMGQWKDWARGCVSKGPQTLDNFEARSTGKVAAPSFTKDGKLISASSGKSMLALTEQSTLYERIEEEYQLKSKSSTTLALQSAGDIPGAPGVAAARHIFSQRAASPDSRLSKKLQNEWLSQANVMKQSLQVMIGKAKPKAKAKVNESY